MGVMTRTQLVSAALNEAGNTSLTTLAQGWLNDWLDSSAAGWPWPQIQRRIGNVALVTGTQSLSVGAGSGGITLRVLRIIDPIWVYSSDYSTRVRARVLPITQSALEWDETINDPTRNLGVPTRFKIRTDETTFFKWSLIPTPVPDRDLLLALDYLCIPAQLTGDSQVPWYPNDRTIRQAIKVAALAYMKRADELQGEREMLKSFVTEDKVKYGEIPGTNDQLGLDPATFG
jgi:hypothetical protein